MGIKLFSCVGGKRHYFRILFVIVILFIFVVHFLFLLKNPASPSPSQFHSSTYRKSSGINLASTPIPNSEQENWLELGLHQTDPRLVEVIKRKLLIPPPPLSERNSRFNESLLGDANGCNRKFNLVTKLLGPHPGFFIESGALDGIFLSSTWRLETTQNWTGLLIEPHPQSFEKLVKTKRNAWKMNTALCVTKVASEIPFWIPPSENSGLAALSTFNKKSFNHKREREMYVNISVPCVPLYAILLAMNRSSVDYLSLDVESAELGILSTLPFDKIVFKVMTIEYDHVPGGKLALKRFLEPKGYHMMGLIDGPMTRDLIFIHHSIYAKSLPVFDKMEFSRAWADLEGHRKINKQAGKVLTLFEKLYTENSDKSNHLNPAKRLALSNLMNDVIKKMKMFKRIPTKPSPRYSRTQRTTLRQLLHQRHPSGRARTGPHFHMHGHGKS